MTPWAFNAGQNSLPKDDNERAERMRAEIRKVKELTSKPFGINIFHSGQNPDVQLELMLKVVYEEKVPVAVVAHDGPEIVEDIITLHMALILRVLLPLKQKQQV